MNNPLRILHTLDRHLTQPAEITIFGRAALALGFQEAPTTFAATNDVDAILPLQWLAAPGELQAAFARARVPDVPEIRELFQAAQPNVLEIARPLGLKR